MFNLAMVQGGWCQCVDRLRLVASGNWRADGWDGIGDGGVPFFQVLDPSHPPLGVDHHFGEEVGKAGVREGGRARAVEVPVVDGFAGGGRAQAGAGLGGRRRGGRGGGGLKGLRGGLLEIAGGGPGAGGGRAHGWGMGWGRARGLLGRRWDWGCCLGVEVMEAAWVMG